MSVIRRAAVVGGGVGGFAAALSLVARGADVTLYEQASAFAEVGAGIQIGPNGMRVLRALGLESAVLACATRPDRLVMRDGRTGARIGVVPFGDTIAHRHGAPYVQVHRADLLSVLAGAADAGGVDLRLGHRVMNGDDVEADVVVAADGARSTFRGGLVPDSAPRFTGHVAWRALVTTDDLLHPPPMDPQLFLGQGRHLVLYPLRQGHLLNVVAVQESQSQSEESWMQSDTAEAVAAAFRDWDHSATAPLSAIGAVHKWGLYTHPELPVWHDDKRLVLLGDACHPMLPYLAQGAVMAMEDAWCLAALLDSRADVPTAFRDYEQFRKPRTTRVQRKAAANGRLYHKAAGPRRAAERAGIAALSAMPGQMLLRQFDWLYGFPSDRL